MPAANNENNGDAMFDGKIGEPVVRREDERLLTGAGMYSDDFSPAGQARAVFVRSPHAHARLGAIDTRAALAVPGVLAVLTGKDLLAQGIKPIPHSPIPAGGVDIELKNRDGSPTYVAVHHVLPPDRARFVGEAVAMVIAETEAQARDGAEAVEIGYEVLPSVTDTAAAAEPGAPALYDDRATNVVLDADAGDKATTDAAFAKAARTTRLDTWVQRCTGVTMEPRAATGSYDAATDKYTLNAGSGGAVRMKRSLAGTLGVTPDKVRVISGDVGGNYGTRNPFYPEFTLVCVAAKLVGRPVKWTCDRSEAFLSDYQGRDLVVSAELAFDADGRILAMRSSNLSNLGAHSVNMVPLHKGIQIMTGLYAVPSAYCRARAVISNTPPTNPYRSAGRPEVVFVLERLMDLAARQHGWDAVALRRKNLIPPEQMPYKNPMGATYDTGEFAKNMKLAVALNDWDGYAKRVAESKARGKKRGRVLINYLESSSGAPRERAEIDVSPEGSVGLVVGTQSSGQGHETSFAQVVVEWLGVPLDSIRFVEGDTDVVKEGGGSHAGRSMRLASIVMIKAADKIIDKGKRIAAHMLEAADADIVFAAGRFTVAGTDRSIGIFDAAKAARDRDDLPAELEGKLDGVADEVMAFLVFPNGCHICEVEVDPDTGGYEVVRYDAIEDVGRIINPLIVHGQSHGGVVQGLGQAMFEHCVYDRATGQMLAGSFMDYGIPRADEVPSFGTGFNEVLTPTNPLGIKAGGEGGTVPALACLVGAICDALAEDGVSHIEMPATPQKVWRAITEARARRVR
jgi:aerobic carbon-monoxide dehydrogenase large subunit